MTNQKHRNKYANWTANQITAYIASSQLKFFNAGPAVNKQRNMKIDNVFEQWID